MTELVTDKRGGASPLLGAVTGSTNPEGRTLPGSVLPPAHFSEVISGVERVRYQRLGPRTFSAPGPSLSHFPRHPNPNGPCASCRFGFLVNFHVRSTRRANSSMKIHCPGLSYPPVKLTSLHSLPCSPPRSPPNTPAQPTWGLHPRPFPSCKPQLPDVCVTHSFRSPGCCFPRP